MLHQRLMNGRFELSSTLEGRDKSVIQFAAECKTRLFVRACAILCRPTVSAGLHVLQVRRGREASSPACE